MPKNVVVYSDGTGQDGGVRPDQRLSNVYKMYRATRVGPDSVIDPATQVAFYDPGLGTDADARGWGRLRKSVGRIMASVAGRGITFNIIDCYEFILNHWRPGDRIFLIGFSRGAYTVRSVAQVIALCGVPVHEPGDPAVPLRRFSRSTRSVAERAVRQVYEHGAGHPRAEFEAEREELARRFRLEFGCDVDGGPNAHPHFVGVFDTVAALGAKGAKRIVLIGLLALAATLILLLLASCIHAVLGARFLDTFVLSAGIAALVTGVGLRRDSRRAIDDWPTEGSPRRVHHIAWRAENYDRGLSGGVGYGRQASAIDEDRDDFPRVPWGRLGVVRNRTEGEPEPLVQLWFPGNHSDVGGSYPETESRLSDIALGWMVDEARSIPHPLIVDDARLSIWPDALGQQHSELEAVRDRLRWLPRWVPARLRNGWKEGMRTPAGFPVHPSVHERFAAGAVVTAAGEMPYRPPALASDARFGRWYGSGGDRPRGPLAPDAVPPMDVHVSADGGGRVSFLTTDPSSVASALGALSVTDAVLLLPEPRPDGEEGDYLPGLQMRWFDRAAARRGVHALVAAAGPSVDPAAARSARLVLGNFDEAADLMARLGFGVSVRLTVALRG